MRSMTNRTFRVICGTCQGQLLLFYTVGGRLTVDVRTPAIVLNGGDPTTAHRETDGRVDIADALADCTDFQLTLECKCTSRTTGLRAHAERAAVVLKAPGKRVTTVTL